MLGIGGDVGYGGCEPRIEGTMYKKVLNNIKKIKKCVWGAEEEGQYLNPKHSLCI